MEFPPEFGSGAGNGRDHVETTALDPHTGFQAEGSACRQPMAVLYECMAHEAQLG